MAFFWDNPTSDGQQVMQFARISENRFHSLHGIGHYYRSICQLPRKITDIMSEPERREIARRISSRIRAVLTDSLSNNKLKKSNLSIFYTKYGPMSILTTFVSPTQKASKSRGKNPISLNLVATYSITLSQCKGYSAKIRLICRLFSMAPLDLT